MAENLVVSVFNVESEAYQAMAELKQNPGTELAVVSQVAMGKKENGEIKLLDSFDTGVNTMDDTLVGGLVGAIIGILGGPVGVLLGGSYGALLGSVMDASDSLDGVSMIEQIAGKMLDGDVAIVALAAEEDEGFLDAQFGKFDTVIMRYDAAVVAEEVAEARELEKEMARQARARFRKEKNEEFKDKVETHRAKIKEHFDGLKKEKA